MNNKMLSLLKNHQALKCEAKLFMLKAYGHAERIIPKSEVSNWTQVFMTLKTFKEE